MTTYATVDEIRAYTRVGTQEFEDEAVDDMISAATAKIDRLTGRTWQAVRTATNEYYTGDGTNRLYLDQKDIGSISALSINISPTGTTYTSVTAARVRVITDMGIIELQPNAEVTYFPHYINSIKITYTYGSATIPDDIKQACFYLVAKAIKRDTELDPDFMSIIDSYRTNSYRIV